MADNIENTRELVKKLAAEWLKLNSIIKLKQKELKTFTNRNKILTKEITDLMEQTSVTTLSNDTSTICYGKKTRKKGLTKKYLLQKIKELQNTNDDEAGKLVNTIYDGLEVTTQAKLIIKKNADKQ